jgi:transposase InsO family protein
MDMGDTPKFMVSDRDGIYGAWFGKFLSDCYDITLYRTPPRTPNCNAYIERWNRTVREELLDHRIIFGERDLRRLLREYVDYFNQARPHQWVFRVKSTLPRQLIEIWKHWIHHHLPAKQV